MALCGILYWQRYAFMSNIPIVESKKNIVLFNFLLLYKRLFVFALLLPLGVFADIFLCFERKVGVWW